MNPYSNVDIYKTADIENYRGKYVFLRAMCTLLGGSR